MTSSKPNSQTTKETTKETPKLGLEQKEIDWPLLLAQAVKVATPYWKDPKERRGALLRLGGVVAFTLGTTGVSVFFNFLGRDFFNSIAEKQPEEFQRLLVVYFFAICAGIPVFVLKDFFTQRLALRWRTWMTESYVGKYFSDRKFYRIQAGSLIDNPDQRINDDISNFTVTALSFTLVMLNSTIDLVSFSGILYSIYPPLFGVLLAYALGGTFLSVKFGQQLVGLNFEQETREANFRYSLVRIRENAESIAFYGGEKNEMQLLLERFKATVQNYGQLLVASRNLDFFTSFYRYIISFLPAAVVAPLFFKGDIEFGVINQSSSAFSHILSDVSIVVYQFEAIAGFSAVTERLYQFTEVLEGKDDDDEADAASSPEVTEGIQIGSLDAGNGNGLAAETLLTIRDLTMWAPTSGAPLLANLTVDVIAGQSLLIMGPSGTGKTSLLRACAGLWPKESGTGTVLWPELNGDGANRQSVFFVPQRPYMVLGSLRQQLLYPTWVECKDLPEEDQVNCELPPSDEELEAVMKLVRLEGVLERLRDRGALNTLMDWSSVLSLGEQQRLAFARLLLAKPRLALLDESTSALDMDNEAHLYSQLQSAGITFISIGHRSSLIKFHQQILQLSSEAEIADENEDDWQLRPISDLVSDGA